MKRRAVFWRRDNVDGAPPVEPRSECLKQIECSALQATPQMRSKIAASVFERLLVGYARHIPLRKAKLRIVNSLWKAAIGEHDTGRLATLKYGGIRIPCDLRDDLQRQLYFFGTYFVEETPLSVWQSRARGAKVIFDVGANLGIYSFAALACEASATVHAFEPTPEIAAQLRKAAELNGLRIGVHEVAVSSKAGHAKLNRFRGDWGTNGGMNFVFGSANTGDPNRVSTIRLDDFCHENDILRIDLLKVDVQGHEYEVFLGAKNLLSRGAIKQIFFELDWRSNPEGGSVASESITLLETAGYEFSAISEKPTWRAAGDWMRSLSDINARRKP
jgi:FkbM family methyltransferase